MISTLVRFVIRNFRLATAMMSAMGAGALLVQAATPSAESLLWDKSFNLRGGFGYKDNVLLSSITKRDSIYAVAGFDAMVFRLPSDGTQFFLFVTGDDQRYLEDAGADKEQTLIAVAKLQKAFREHWEAALSVQYLFQNQVLDVSATESDLTTVQLQGHSIKTVPSLKRKFLEHYSAGIELAVDRQFLREPLDSYWESGPKLLADRAYGHRSSIALSYEYAVRFYDRRSETDELGSAIDGTSLEFRQHEFEMSNRHYWDQQRRWRSDTKVSFQINEDSGSGFFDYYRYGIGEQLRYAAKSWNIQAGARAYIYDYHLQTVGPDDPDLRQLTSLALTIRGEKNLFKSLKLFGEIEHEQSLSNRSSNEYRANSIVTGLDWEF